MKLFQMQKAETALLLKIHLSACQILLFVYIIIYILNFYFDIFITVKLLLANDIVENKHDCTCDSA